MIPLENLLRAEELTYRMIDRYTDKYHNVGKNYKAYLNQELERGLRLLWNGAELGKFFDYRDVMFNIR